MKISHYILSIVFASASFLSIESANAQSGPFIFNKAENDAREKYPNKMSSDRMQRAEKKAFQWQFKGDRVTGPKYQGMGQPVASINDDFAKSKGYYSEKQVKKVAKAKEKSAPAAEKVDQSSMAVE